VLDLANFNVVDDECMWLPESDINSDELKLKHEVETSITTAQAVEEQK
jgi:hypothetical protein